MREIHGYLCLASREPNTWEYFYGLNENNFEWNGLIPYSSLKAATACRKALSKDEMFKRLRLARVDMYMAETHHENMHFRNETQLVVISKSPKAIWDIDSSMILLGPCHGDSQRFGCEQGSQLLHNSFLPFSETLEKEWALAENWQVLTAYKQAERVADEVMRQSKREPLMATWAMSWRGEEWIRD